MALELGVTGADLVGRATELEHIGKSLEATMAGTACTVVVAGDPGVGKTALVAQACASGSAEILLLAGAALPLASITVPFLALRAAIRQVPSSSNIQRPGFGAGGWAANDVVVSIDEWFTDVCRLRPVVLVIDDLQWADQSTLDALMYLIAGPPDRRLSILTTLRSGELGEQHPLRRWLADIRRMPRISWITLVPLDRSATGAQLARLLGAPQHQSLVEEVFSHTAGNAYLNRLMVDGLVSGTRHLPQKLPEDLKAAVLRSWRGLSAGARHLTRLMAVGGRPILVKDLAGLALQEGTVHDAAVILREATEAGITECLPDARHWWFHHPMISEVLEQGLESGRRRDWHALFAAYGARLVAEGTSVDFEFMAAMSRHHYAAGNTAEAYRWTLLAVAAADETGGANQVPQLLKRALALHDDLPQVQESREELLIKLCEAAEALGSMEEELDTIQILLDGMDTLARPLDAAELLVRRALLRFSSGQEFFSRVQLLKAVRLAQTSPESWQYAYALAELAHLGLWENEAAAPRQAQLALTVARKAGNPRALSYALTANSMAALLGQRPQEARALASSAATAAETAHDFWALLHATTWEANASEAWSSREFADLMHAGRQRMAMLGSPNVYLSKMAADEAASYLSIGSWRECAGALRVALGTDPGPLGDVAARLTAARLATLQGRQEEARAHLARAEELFAHQSGYNNLDFDAVRAEVLLAEANPGAAYTAAMAGAGKAGQPPTMCEWLIPLAARALADLVQGSRDEGKNAAALLGSCDELVRRFPEVFRETGNTSAFYDAQICAFNLLYRAEIGRARAVAENAVQWADAAEACAAGSLLWEEAYSCWRAVQALLHHGHSGHGQATTILRRGLLLAADLQARPISESLLEIAARARISVDLPTTGTPAAHLTGVPGLTRREHEILSHVVAGRTYAEIAKTLVISEKTVSSHISNMLRKTGTQNRLDLARLATRLASRHSVL